MNPYYELLSIINEGKNKQPDYDILIGEILVNPLKVKAFGEEIEGYSFSLSIDKEVLAGGESCILYTDGEKTVVLAVF